jgi:NADH-quinone oxidoreductase subunit H
MTEWLQNLHPALLALIRVALLLLPILMLVPLLIWWERRLLSWMQDRIGPNRVGPFGLLQTLADGIKLFFKEDIMPRAVDRAIYIIAPAVALFPAFALGATMPWGPNYGFYGLLTPVADVSIGLLYILAISSLGVYGIVLAGYASNNKYSLLGGLRSSAQLISYELAMVLALAGVALATGSLRLTDMVRAQEMPWLSTAGAGVEGATLVGGIPYVQNWLLFTPYGLIAGVIFAICVVAETNRVPFDLPEAENELIAGYHTEYSSMKFAVFFMGEYAAMFVFSGIFVVAFLGGYNMLPLQWEAMGAGTMQAINYWGAPIWFIGKTALVFSLFIWLRATLPRLRYDQLMAVGWRSLLPAAVANFIIVATWIAATAVWGVGAGWIAFAGTLLLAIFVYQSYKRAAGGIIVANREITMVDQEPRRVRMVEGGETGA